jgi:putative peptide zinc metalloprotease protein
MSESTTSSGTALPPSGAATAAPDRGRASGSSRVPALAGGVELLGEMQGSGYESGQFLVRRADGQTIQLTPLLYRVLEAVDGRRDLEAVAEHVSAATGRLVTADNVRQLLEGKLGSLGLLRLADGSEPEARKTNPLLALRFRYVVTDPAVTRRITRPFAVLFTPLLVGLLVAAFAAVAWWVLFSKGLASATHDAFATPSLLLLVVAVTVVSAGFHEFGHAAACRYGGATPGVMGAGLYLVWPAFYTEVSDSYRLGRAGRVRVDLGGLYFNAIVAVAIYGAWALTRWDALLLVIAAQVLQMVRQLAPLVRFDGYHVLADLTGVPDLYQRIGPTLKGLWPTNWGKPETKVLKPWARTVVTVWVLVVVPLLLFSLAMMVVAMPRVAATAWQSLGRETREIGAAFGDGDLPAIGVGLLSVVAIALPLVGMAYLLLRLLRRLVTGVRRWAAGSRGRSTLAAVVAAAVVAALAFLWWPDGRTYRPIQSYEHGTILDAVPSALTGSAGSVLRDGQVASVDRTLWASTSEPPTKDDPQLALVMVPVSGPGAGGDGEDAAPAWVFPFDRPDAPAEGDNQALAVNTEDGSTVYDVAFALVWADDGSVLNANEAYAFASCRDCRTVAVAFQVVLAVGQTNVAVPQNLSGALNYSCVECVTYALAKQLVVTLPEGLSDEARARLEELWTEIAQYGAGLRDVPLDQIQADLQEYEDRIAQVLADDAAATRADSDADTAESTASPGPEASGTPTGSATQEPTAGTTQGPTATRTSGGTPAPSTTSTSGSTPTSTAGSTRSGTTSPSPSTTSTGTTSPTTTG